MMFFIALNSKIKTILLQNVWNCSWFINTCSYNRVRWYCDFFIFYFFIFLLFRFLRPLKVVPGARAPLAPPLDTPLRSPLPPLPLHQWVWPYPKNHLGVFTCILRANKILNRIIMFLTGKKTIIFYSIRSLRFITFFYFVHDDYVIHDYMLKGEPGQLFTSSYKNVLFANNTNFDDWVYYPKPRKFRLTRSARSYNVLLDSLSYSW